MLCTKMEDKKRNHGHKNNKKKIDDTMFFN